MDGNVGLVVAAASLGRSDPQSPALRGGDAGWHPGGGRWLHRPVPSAGLTHHPPMAERGFPSWPLPPHRQLWPPWQARTGMVCRACPHVPAGELIQPLVFQMKGSWRSAGGDMGSRKHPLQHLLPRKRRGTLIICL